MCLIPAASTFVSWCDLFEDSNNIPSYNNSVCIKNRTRYTYVGKDNHDDYSQTLHFLERIYYVVYLVSSTFSVSFVFAKLHKSWIYNHTTAWEPNRHKKIARNPLFSCFTTLNWYLINWTAESWYHFQILLLIEKSVSI